MKLPSFMAGKTKYLYLPFILLFLALLSIYAIKGTYSRYAQDDYCYAYRVRETGFWNTQVSSFVVKAEYVSNRFSTTLGHSLVEELGGPRFVPWLLTLEILAWGTSLVYLLHHVGKTWLSGTSLLQELLAALVILFFGLYLAPEQYQLLFWLAANQTYLVPLILATFLLGRFLAHVRSPGVNPWKALEMGCLSFFASGFSETTGVWQFVIWSMVFTCSVLPTRKPGGVNSRTLRAYVVINGLASAAALFLLALSPANNRSPNWSPGSLPVLVGNSLLHGAEFLWFTVRSTPLPFIALAAFGFLVGSVPRSERRVTSRSALAGILVMFVAIYLLSAANMVPIKLAEASDSYPGARSLLPTQYSLVIGFFASGWWLANAFWRSAPAWLSAPLAASLLGLMAVLLFVYVLRATPRVVELLPQFTARAKAWDLRQEMILEDKAAGMMDLLIPQFDSVFGITELKPDPNNWVNLCAARYYGVSSLTAVEDYQGVPAYPIGK